MDLIQERFLLDIQALSRDIETFPPGKWLTFDHKLKFEKGGLHV